MRTFALILAIAAFFQQGTMGKSSNEFVPVEPMDNSDYLESLQKDLSGVTLREAPGSDAADQKSLCYVVKENEAERQITCGLRLPRSSFNFNPFGLRFGKRARGDAPRASGAGAKTSKLLPYLMFIRDLGLSA
uniref:Kisspeptin 2 n=1 Tax=Paramormyrops kingsleyae TaxID=1676925 RepID=A0A3B3S251_9TELE